MAATTKLIDVNLKSAARVLVEGLQAVHYVPQIIGRDSKGHPEYEYIERPDHHVRLKAAKILLDKRIPDVSRVETDVNMRVEPWEEYIARLRRERDGGK